MKIGIPKEIHDGEKRVATTPDVAKHLIKLGFEVLVESSAGEGSHFSDIAYTDAGVTVVEGAKEIWEGSDIIFKVRPPEFNSSLNSEEVDLLHEKQVIITFLWPAQNPDLLKKLAEKKVTALSMDSVPRISRAQKMDALSSMANIAGYRAVVEAAQHFGRFFTGQITAAGKIPPAKVMVIGAGVAGLAAIGAAKALEYGLGWVGVLMMSAMTATGGGLIRDLLLRQVPMILHSDFYASAAIIGGAVYMLGHFSGLGEQSALLLSASTAIASRFIAMKWNLSLPKITNEPE